MRQRAGTPQLLRNAESAFGLNQPAACSGILEQRDPQAEAWDRDALRALAALQAKLKAAWARHGLPQPC